MSLSAADIQEIMRLVEASHFDELVLEADGVKLVLRRGAAVASTAAPAAAPAAAAMPSPAVAVATGATAHAAAGAAVASAAAPAAASRAPDAGQDVAAPMLGTFYRAPKPGAPPFVEVDALVEPDTVIGIIEVMKLMNTVRAGLKGRVTAILATDGALVEYGQPLLRIAPGG